MGAEYLRLIRILLDALLPLPTGSIGRILLQEAFALASSRTVTPGHAASFAQGLRLCTLATADSGDLSVFQLLFDRHLRCDLRLRIDAPYHHGRAQHKETAHQPVEPGEHHAELFSPGRILPLISELETQ